MDKEQSREVKIISEKRVFDKFHTLDEVIVQPSSLAHDGFAEPMSREVFYCGHASSVLPYIPETDEILLIEQFRFGAFYMDSENPWMLEMPGGIVDKGESPEEAAIREMLEESGAEVLDTEFITAVHTSPGSVADKAYLYCCRISPSTDTGIFGSHDEEIKSHKFPAKELIKMLDDGKINSGTTYSALSWFARNHDRLKEKWT